MTHVSLFTGIGGLDLAAEWAGFTTVLQVERDPYCLKVLEKHWPGVPRMHDVREVTSESVSGAVDLVSGGFPCQPFSAAGKRRGVADDRHLWPEMYRVIRELAPRWVVAENVPGLLSLNGGLVFESVCADLERVGYTVQPVVVPAAGVGAPHLRYRVFVVGHAMVNTEHRRSQVRWSKAVDEVAASDERRQASHNVCAATTEPGVIRDSHGDDEPELPIHAEVSGEQDVADSRFRTGWAGLRQTGEEQDRAEPGDGGDAPDSRRSVPQERSGPSGERAYSATRGSSWWATEPAVGRVAYGVPHRVDRLRALGNAVVPQQAYPIFKAIMAVEARV